MADILDIIHRLSYEVVGETNLKGVIDNLQKQAEKIDILKGKLADLNKMYMTEENVAAQQNLSGAINKTTEAINQQSNALRNQFLNNKQLQQALSDEVGLIQQLNQFITQHTKERATLTDISQIRIYTEQIKGAQNELATLFKPDMVIRQAGAIETVNNRLTILKNTLKTVPKENIEAVNLEIAKTQKQLIALQSIGIAPKETPSALSSLFGGGSLLRQILQGGLLGLGIGSGFGLVSRAVSGLIEFAEVELDATKKAEQLQKANDGLASSFDNLADSIEKAAAQEKILINDEEKARGIDITLEGYKQKLELLKAIGVQNDEVYADQKRQFDQQEKINQLDINDAKDKSERLNREQAVLEVALDAVKKAEPALDVRDPSSIAGAGETALRRAQLRAAKAVINEAFPSDLANPRLIALDKAFDEGGDIQKTLEAQIDKTKSEAIKANDEVVAKVKEGKDLQTKFESDLSREYLSINKKLNVDIAAENEKYRELKEKEDIASVDKIVADTQAKYKALIVKLGKEEEIELKKLPANDPRTNIVKGKYGRLFSLLAGQKKQDEANQIFEFNRAQFFTEGGNNAAELSGRAGLSKFANAFGLPDYNRSADSEDAQRQAELANASKTFNELSEKYRQSGQSTTEIEKQYTTQVEQIEQSSYTRRLQLASDYFAKVSANIIAVNNYLLTNDEVGILNKKHPFFTKDSQLNLAQGRRSRDSARRQIPEAETAVDIDQQKAVNAGTTDETAQAANQTISDEQKLADVKKQKAEAEKQIHDAKVDQFEQELDLYTSLADTAVKSYSIIAEARQKDLDREIAVHTERISLAYKLAERGNTQALALEQKALDTANQQKRQAALTDQEINAALTVSNALVAVAKAAAEGGILAPATIAIAIAAIGVGFAEASALSASQKQTFFKGGFTGDGGKYEDAGTVHKGEFVFTKETTAKHRELFEAIHKGYEPFPVMAKPDYGYSSSGAFATKRDLKQHGEMIVGAILGKEVTVSQSIDRRGFVQIVREDSREHANAFRG